MKDNASDSSRREVVHSGPALKAEGIDLMMGERWRMREGARLPREGVGSHCRVCLRRGLSARCGCGQAEVAL